MSDLYDILAEDVHTALQHAPLGTLEDDRTRIREAIATRLRPRVETLFGALAVEQRPCKSCGTMIWFVKTANDKQMPVSPNLTSHFADCPHAAQHRKPRPVQPELIAAVGYPE